MARCDYVATPFPFTRTQLFVLFKFFKYLFKLQRNTFEENVEKFNFRNQIALPQFSISVGENTRYLHIM
jgi:hypothetical protein